MAATTPDSTRPPPRWRPATKRPRAASLHSADLADLLEALGEAHRAALLEALGPGLDPGALAELDAPVRDNVLESIDDAEIAAAAALDTDDAAYLVEDMEESARRRVLDAMPAGDRRLLETALSYPENIAGRPMQRGYVAAPAFRSVGQVIDRLRKSGDLPDEFYEIFVVDPRHRPVGAVPLHRAMRSRRDAVVADIMRPDARAIPVDMDREEVAYRFKQCGGARAGDQGADGGERRAHSAEGMRRRVDKRSPLRGGDRRGGGAAIGLAIVVNLPVAGASGMPIPLALARAGADPAVSAGVLLTTVTDAVGFFAFLALAKAIVL